MITKTQVLDFIKKNRTFFKEKYNITKIGIFGSVAREQNAEDSDIDLILEFEEGTPDLYHKKQEIKKLFSIKFNANIDICREKYIKPLFKNDILSETIYVQ